MTLVVPFLRIQGSFRRAAPHNDSSRGRSLAHPWSDGVASRNEIRVLHFTLPLSKGRWYWSVHARWCVDLCVAPAMLLVAQHLSLMMERLLASLKGSIARAAFWKCPLDIVIAPLQELAVLKELLGGASYSKEQRYILKFALRKTVHWDFLSNSKTLTCVLQNFQVMRPTRRLAFLSH